MTKNDCDFDTWAGNIQVTLLDEVGLDFKDWESIRDDYNKGRDMYDVVDEIANEYK